MLWEQHVQDAPPRGRNAALSPGATAGPAVSRQVRTPGGEGCSFPAPSEWPVPGRHILAVPPVATVLCLGFPLCKVRIEILSTPQSLQVA